MNTLTDLIDRYIATWNETDAGRRRDLIARTWTEGASYLDPMLQGEGTGRHRRDDRRVQERFPAIASAAPATSKATMIASASPGTWHPRTASRW